MLTGFSGMPVVASNPPAAVLMVLRSLCEIITSIPAGWPAVLAGMGTNAFGLSVKLTMTTAVAPALRHFVTLSVKVVVPRLTKTILPEHWAALLKPGPPGFPPFVFASFGTA